VFITIMFYLRKNMYAKAKMARIRRVIQSNVLTVPL